MFIGRILLNICQRYAKYSENETQIELSISRHGMANLFGIRRETLSRISSKFQQEQLISI